MITAEAISTSCVELDITKDADRIRASNAVASGQVIAPQTITYGLWTDSTNQNALNEVNKAKGRPPGTPMALVVPDLCGLTQIFDFSRIDPELHSLFNNQQQLEHRIASRCLIKIPVLPQAEWHGHSLSPHLDPDDQGGWLLFLYFGQENQNAQKLVEALYQKAGLVGVTSMNEHGQPTITEKCDAIQFCHVHSIPYFIKDPLAKYSLRQGSYPLVMVGKAGELIPKQKIVLQNSIHLLRPESNLPRQHVEYLFPEVFGPSPTPMAEIVPSQFFNLAARRDTPDDFVQAVFSFALDAINGQF